MNKLVKVVFFVLLFVLVGELFYIFYYPKIKSILPSYKKTDTKDSIIESNKSKYLPDDGENPYVALVVKDRKALFNYADSDFEMNNSVGEYFINKVCEYPQDNYLTDNKPTVPVEDLSIKPKALAFYALRGFACKPKTIRDKQVMLIHEKGRVVDVIKDKYMLKLIPLGKDYGLKFNSALQYDAEKTEFFIKDTETSKLRETTVDEVKKDDVVEIEYEYDYIRGGYNYYKLTIIR